MRYLFIILSTFYTLSILAARSVRMSLKQKSDSTTIFTDKGDSCFSAYNYFQASHFYEKACGITPKVCNARKLANAYRKLGQNRECAMLLKMIPKDSVHYDDIRTLYYVYRSIDDIDSLLFYGDSALRVNPFDMELVVSMSSYCNSINKPEKAAVICKTYLERDSDNIFVTRQLGYASFLIGDYQAACQCYRKLEKVGLSSFESNLIMGLSLKKLGETGAAYDYLLKAAKLKGFKHYTSLHNLGEVCIKIGFIDEGIGYLQQAVALLTPDSTQLYALHTELGEAFFDKHNYKETADQFEQSARFSPDNPIVYYNIAQMYGAVGDKKKVKENYIIFIKKSNLLKDDEDNNVLIEKAKTYLSK